MIEKKSLRGGGGRGGDEEEEVSQLSAPMPPSALLVFSLQSALKIQNNDIYFCLLFYICCAVGRV